MAALQSLFYPYPFKCMKTFQKSKQNVFTHNCEYASSNTSRCSMGTWINACSYTSIQITLIISFLCSKPSQFGSTDKIQIHQLGFINSNLHQLAQFSLLSFGTQQTAASLGSTRHVKFPALSMQHLQFHLLRVYEPSNLY